MKKLMKKGQIFTLLVAIVLVISVRGFAEISILCDSISAGGVAGDSVSTYLINDNIGTCFAANFSETGDYSELPENYGPARFYDVRWLVWYLSEGATLNSIDEWITIQNPYREAAQVKITFMKSNGEIVEDEIEIGATTRYTVYANDYVPNESISTKVESLNGIGIIVERAMYRSSYGIEWASAHCSIGVNEPATTWYLAEGATLNGIDQWVTIQNPSESTAQVTVSFMKTTGEVVTEVVEIVPTSRYTIHVNDIVPEEELSTLVEATNGVGIIVERAMYRSSGGVDWVCAHDSIGVTEPATTWYLAEGATLNDIDEWVTIQNPSNSTALVTVTFMKPTGETVEDYLEILPTSRYTVYVNDYVPEDSVSTKVETTNGVGIIVERAMYRDCAGIEWASAHCSVGVTSPATTWYLAEGATLNDIDEWITIQNPSTETAQVTATFMKATGETVEHNIEVLPTSRYTIYVNDIVPNESVSAKVEATNDIGIIVERAMYRTSVGTEGIYANETLDWVSAHCSIGIAE